MKRSFILNLDSLTDLTNFCTEISSNIAADVDAAYGRQTVDAKSYLGLITISTHPIQVYINSENCAEIAKFNEICSKYPIVYEV